ncbi:serine phosphatase RsbU (regulator of sigma subunit) [Thermonema lapsum]|uniref:Serine phosphatase RsbU (Regulator of sigma subunit) n=1 Tax=Thermonema lapsum TaxID=28195 RepID=A0A846MMG3_9BACT|nr:SpoIIE family protein phosphatase [Thermonema lapsum]NIK72659.1 serine phosphatase RsbU (regulator of sigma subunit) [Thermonema lapsum]
MSISIFWLVVFFIFASLLILWINVRYQSRLREREETIERYRQLVDEANDAIVVVDMLDSSLLWSNAAFHRLTQNKEGKYLYHFVPPELVDTLSRRIARTYEEGGLVFQDIPLMVGDNLLDVEFSGKVVPFEANRPAVTFYIRDIRERVRLTKQIELQNKKLLESIRYAQRIQIATLPSESLFKEMFPNSFILYKPKDIVCGDFYYYQQTRQYRYVIAADATGHGVPGALLSMLGITFLVQLLHEDANHTPAELLNLLRENIVQALSRSEEDKNQLRDGMDMAVIRVGGGSIVFAGAHNGALIIQRSEIHDFKGDRMPIGYVEQKMEESFTNHTIPLLGGEKVYIFSDGFADQFGGPKKQKLSSRRFKELLLEKAALPFDQQKQSLEVFFEQWRGNQAQIDDVLVMGFEV